MKRRSILPAIITISFLTTGIVRAQVKPDDKSDPGKSAITEEIDVVRAYKPVLAEAVKIRRSPDLRNNKPFKPNLTYTIPDQRLELNADIRKLQAQQLADEPEKVLKNNYLSVAAGNLNTGMGEVYLNTGKDEALQAGAFFKHLSQEGKLNGQRFTREEFGAYGRSIQDKFALSGNAGFKHTGYRFYGFDPFAAAAPASTASQHYNLLTLKGEIANRYGAETNNVDYSADAAAYLLRNAFDGSENGFSLNAGANRKFGDFQIGAIAGIDYTGTSDSAYSISNVVLKLNPFLRLKGERYEITTGLSLYRENLGSRTSLLPAVTAEVQLVPGFVTLFGGFTGSVLKTTLRGLSEENRFLGQNVVIKNALEKSMISGGIKGNAGSGVGYKATAYFKTVENLPLFVNNPADIQKFGVVYDKSTDVLGFDGELSISSPGVFVLTGKVSAASYSLSTETKAWFKPAMQLSANATFFINSKFKVNGELLFSGESNARVVLPTAPDGVARIVDGFTDLSAGAEYRIRNRVGLFARVNNLFNSTYERYLYYPVNGLNAIGGLNYSF